MKHKVLLVFIMAFSFLNLNAQQGEGYRLKVNFYESLLDELLNAGNLNKFSYTLNKLDLETKHRVFSNDRKSYSIETILPNDEKILVGYLYPSGEAVRIIFIHQTDIYNFIKSYLNENTIYNRERGMWYNYKKNLIISYEINSSTVAILNIYSTSYEW